MFVEKNNKMQQCNLQHPLLKPPNLKYNFFSSNSLPLSNAQFDSICKVNLLNVTSFFSPTFSLESLNLPIFGFFSNSSSQNQEQMATMDYMDQFKGLLNQIWVFQVLLAPWVSLILLAPKLVQKWIL